MIIQHCPPNSFFLGVLVLYLSALHMLMQYGFVSYSSYKILSISRQQDILLRNVAGITAAADFSGLARSCPMALKLSEHCHRAEWGHYTLSQPLLSDGKKVETIRPALRAAVLTDHGQTKVNLCASEPSSQWEVFDISSQLCCGGELLPSCLSTGSWTLIEKSWNGDFHFDSLFMNNSSIALWITNQWFWVKDQTRILAELSRRKTL